MTPRRRAAQDAEWDPIRRALLDDLQVFSTVEQLIAEGQFDHIWTARATRLGWKAPLTEAELERMAKLYGSAST